MKKLVIAVSLLFAAVICARAQQSVSVLGKAARLAYDFLVEEGYKPSIDEDDDVIFKAQGYSFYVDNNVNDETYLRVVLPAIEELEDEDDIAATFAALATCSDITRTKKLVKAYMSDEGVVSLAAETYLGSSGNMDEFLDTAIDFLIRSCKSWRETYKDYLDD